MRGAFAQSYGREVAVQTVRDGQTVTLDRGRIDPASLRVVDGQSVWTRRP